MNDVPAFPRTPDGKSRAWGGDPTDVWYRYSPAYEAQAEALVHAIAAAGLTPALAWAGSEDGEAAVGRDASGEVVVLFHLEDPAEARRIAEAMESGRLGELIAEAR